ncbi:hypothetical protein QBC37DRAFT_420168 [Rhypophila decipiens]|uniref:Uncharacterized protein n=1 Tax=Rhypophila decipiens TaxID=261697 RepID=A0AAN7B913_9PEZI|nr:hypothetical protein QBC37DRAFT_420168 [Rhypophila decipiens]
MFSQACPDFLNLAIRLELLIYAKEFLEDHEDRRKDALIAALMKPMSAVPGHKIAMGSYDELNLDLARHALNLGVSPNEPADTRDEYHMAIPVTIWSQFLHQCMYDVQHHSDERLGGCSTDTAFSILHLLLTHGAMPTAVEWNTLRNAFSSNQYSELKFAWENSIKNTTSGEDQWNPRSQARLGVPDRYWEVESGSEEEKDTAREQRAWEVESEFDEENDKLDQQKVKEVESESKEENDKAREKVGNAVAVTLEARAEDDVQTGSQGVIRTDQLDTGRSRLVGCHTPDTTGRVQALKEEILPSREVVTKRRRGIWKWMKRKR